MSKRETLPLPLTELTAITTLDGRYRGDIVELAPYVSEYNLIRTRIEVEAKYLVALSDIGIVRPLTEDERTRLNSFGTDISLEDADRVKTIEDKTRHDVKAMERAFREMVEGTSLENITEMIHFGLTSEDINNLAYRLMLKRATDNIMIPALNNIIDPLTDLADKYKAVPMLARTHGQPAVPTTIGKEAVVFADRLNKETRELEERQLTGKLTGVVGNLNALQAARPDVDWIGFCENFVRSFGFTPNLVTTQINPYEDMIAYFQNYQRINGILTDFDQDLWRYISDFWMAQEVKEGEVGSSTLTQKVNPISFENSEGNLGLANAIFEFFSRKLAVSRLQRDLSDSTVIRNIGTVLGFCLVSYKNSAIGLARVSPNEQQIAGDLERDWAILGEGVQTVLRATGFKDPYSLMADLTRGKHFKEQEWMQLIDGLPVDKDVKDRLKTLTPQTYIGLAVQLTGKAIDEIRATRNKKR